MRFMSKTQLTDWALGSERLWLFLDYDGTLADFAATPFDVEPNGKVIGLLKQLVLRPTYRVTILSGRRLKHIRQLLPIHGLFLAGTYGLELLTPSGETIDRADFFTLRPILETIKPHWSQLIMGKDGFLLEDKGWTLAIHARFADDREAELILAQARDFLNLEQVTEHFRVLGGHKFLEVAPLLASKKETVAYLMDQFPFPDAQLLYIGDDDKDEEAFPLIHDSQGIALKVLHPSQMSRPTEADLCFGAPADTLMWLQKLV